MTALARIVPPVEDVALDAIRERRPDDAAEIMRGSNSLVLALELIRAGMRMLGLGYVTASNFDGSKFTPSVTLQCASHGAVDAMYRDLCAVGATPTTTGDGGEPKFVGNAMKHWRRAEVSLDGVQIVMFGPHDDGPEHAHGCECGRRSCEWARANHVKEQP